MIPISDANPSANKAIVTISLISICIFVYIFLTPGESSFGEYLYKYAAIPCELLNNSPLTDTQLWLNECESREGEIIFANKNILYSIFYSPLIHSGFLHLLGNIWSLWIFGDNVEDALGKIKTIFFIFLTAILSIYGHALLNPSSTIPIVGASGIVSAFMGAYLFMFPNARILAFLIFPFLMPVTIKAKTFMTFWIISQLALTFQTTNISWEAHIFGFISGYFIVRYIFKLNR